MHLCQLITIDAENVCVYVTQMEKIKGKKYRKEEKKKFSWICVEIYQFMFCFFFLGDPHLSSIGDGRGTPVGRIFQIQEEKKKGSRKESSTFCFVSFRKLL